MNLNKLYEDTRQKVGKHILKNEAFSQLGYNVERKKLDVGDYMFDGGKISVDTKQGMQEIYSDIISDHERFRNECILAQQLGITLYILVENTDGLVELADVSSGKWKNPQWYRYIRSGKKGRPPVSNVSLMKMMFTIEQKYGCEFVFCNPEEAGEKVIELLTSE